MKYYCYHCNKNQEVGEKWINVGEGKESNIENIMVCTECERRNFESESANRVSMHKSLMCEIHRLRLERKRREREAEKANK